MPLLYTKTLSELLKSLLITHVILLTLAIRIFKQPPLTDSSSNQFSEQKIQKQISSSL
jgi:hypothetical protein